MSAKKIDVSIVIPVYNGGEALGRVVEKILRENRISLELIVVNDGSTDTTAEILHAISDPRLVVIHQENQGVYAARNAAIARRRGDWLILLDADDDFSEDMIYTRFCAATRLDVDVYIANGERGDLRVCGSRREVHSHQQYHRIMNGISWIRHAISVREWPHYLWLQIIRSDYIEKLQLRFEAGRSHKDILWTAALALGDGRFYLSDKPDYLYCANHASITRSNKYYDSRTLSYVDVISQLIRWAKNPQYHDVKRALLIHALEETRHFYGMYRKKTKDKPYARAQFCQRIRFIDLLKGVNSARKLWFLLRFYITLGLTRRATSSPATDCDSNSPERFH